MTSRWEQISRTHAGSCAAERMFVEMTARTELPRNLSSHVTGLGQKSRIVAVGGSGLCIVAMLLTLWAWSGPIGAQARSAQQAKPVHVAELSLGTQAATMNQLGSSVAFSADGETALVGAFSRSLKGVPHAGTAEVYRFSGGTWSSPTELNLGTVAEANDLFGLSVALSADGNTALVGVPRRTVNGQTNAGVAEVFRFSAGSWGSPTELSLGTAAAAGDAFGSDAGGSSLALSANGNIALIGVPDRTVNGYLGRGAAEVFTFDGNAWSAPTQLDGPSLPRCHNFGGSVALSSTGSTALVGAYRCAVNGRADAGMADVFTLNGGTWGAPVQLSLGTRAAKGDEFGWAVALRADGRMALAGVPWRTVHGHKLAGVAEVFSLSGGKWSAPTELSLASKARYYDFFGESVALSADGHTALVGAVNRGDANGKHSGRGAAEMFTLSNGKWQAPVEMSLGLAGGRAGLGASVKLSANGQMALVGAPRRVINHRSYAGAAEVFR